MAKDKPASETAGAAEAVPAVMHIAADQVPDGVRVKAPPEMDSISVGGVTFHVDEERFFALPAHLVAAALAHIESFGTAAKREAKRVADAAKRLEREKDIPGRIKALEERLATLEEVFGGGVGRG